MLRFLLGSFDQQVMWVMTTRPSPSFLPATVGVIGAGAVGSYYGAKLARAGYDVTLVARPAHVAAIERDGLCVTEGGVDGPRSPARPVP